MCTRIRFGRARRRFPKLLSVFGLHGGRLRVDVVRVLRPMTSDPPISMLATASGRLGMCNSIPTSPAGRSPPSVLGGKAIGLAQRSRPGAYRRLLRPMSSGHGFGAAGADVTPPPETAPTEPACGPRRCSRPWRSNSLKGLKSRAWNR